MWWLLLAMAALGGTSGRKRGAELMSSATPPISSGPGGAGVTSKIPPGAARRWVWPLPRLADGRAPRVSSGWGSPRGTGTPGAHSHVGVDVMYRRVVLLPEGTKLPLPDHGSRGFELPAGTPVLAASAGTVWSTGHTERGYSVTISHPGTGWATWYQHLETLAIPPHARGKLVSGGPPMQVGAGHVLGAAGWSKLDGHQVRHLHFEVRLGTAPFDAQRMMETKWEVIS